jgi:hypothetical protein
MAAWTPRAAFISDLAEQEEFDHLQDDDRPRLETHPLLQGFEGLESSQQCRRETALLPRKRKSMHLAEIRLAQEKFGLHAGRAESV